MNFSYRFLISVLVLHSFLCSLSVDGSLDAKMKLDDLANGLARCGSQCGRYVPLLVDSSIRERQINRSCFLNCKKIDGLDFSLSSDDLKVLAKEPVIDAKPGSLKVLCVESSDDKKFSMKFRLDADDTFFPVQAPDNFAVVRMVQLWRRRIIEGIQRNEVIRVQYGFSTTFAVPLTFEEGTEQFRIQVKTFTQHGSIGSAQQSSWLTQKELRLFPDLRQNELTEQWTPQMDYYCSRSSEYTLLGEIEYKKEKIEEVSLEDHKNKILSFLVVALCAVVALLLFFLILIITYNCRLRNHLIKKENTSNCSIEVRRNSMPGYAPEQSIIVDDRQVLTNPSSFWENIHLAVKSTPMPPSTA